MKRRLCFVAAGCWLLVAGGQGAWGQDPAPGFRNPTTFNSGSNLCFWSARVGERVNASSTTDTTTGYYIKSTCAASNCQDITGHANIVNASRNSGADGGISCCNDGSLWDANDRRFQIITSENAGLDQFTVNSAGVGMPRIAPGYVTSIRLGDPRATGNAAGSISWAPGTNKGAEALFYTMRVTAENALLFINYAVVARCYPHQAYQAGEFLIRVVLREEHEDAEGNITYTWANQPINDSLWFKVSAPEFPMSGVPGPPWVVGRLGGPDCSATTCKYVYKPWAKVAISLNKFLYKTVRIEMYTSDCIYDVDPIYAYIAGDYRPMKISSSGCADAGSQAIDTLAAPEGLLSYTWYVCTTGPEQRLLDQDYMETVPFRQVSPTSTDNRYMPTLNDFILSAGPNAGDTAAEQTFMCVMTSALDPNKPFASKIYANVENGKPSPYIRYISDATTDCNLGVSFHNQSITYGNNPIDTDSTRWIVYSDSVGSGVLDTLWGDDVFYRFPEDGYYKVTMRVKVFGKDCGSETSVVCRALQGHGLPISLSENSLCEGERVVATCEDVRGLEKVWHLGDSVVYGGDTVMWRPPVGTQTLTLTTTTDSLCPVTTSAAVNVLGNSSINSSVDASIVCAGDPVTLTAEGIENPRWSAAPPDTSLDSQQGRNTVVVYPQSTTTYTVVPSQASRCVQNNSSIKIAVLQYPVPTIVTNRPYVDISNPTLLLEDRSPNGGNSQWTFSDGLIDQGQRIEHTFAVNGDSVSVSLHTCNEQRCCADTTVWLPVLAYNLWIPNVFTPDEPINNRFAFVSTIPIQEFEIWIFNRWGNLVHHGTDFEQGWDGMTDDGRICPQGAYVYSYRYSSFVEPDRTYTGRGTVTLLR